MLGFIILRHVNSVQTNLYWIECLKCIRRFYSNPVMIIDDNSNYELISKNINLNNVTIVQSEFPSRGELLPYYYFHKLKPFDTAVILHDSVLIQKYIDFDNIRDVKFLWSFEHHWDSPDAERTLLKTLNNNEELLNLYNEKSKWVGCFGGMSVITHQFLSTIVEKYDMFRLLDYIHCRPDRCNFERVFATLC